jgi:hypothetical protein
MLSRLLKVLFVLSIAACSADGKMYKGGESKFDLNKTILAVGAAAVTVAAVAACADSEDCRHLMGGGSKNTNSFTGGPYFDWDQFTDGQFRCRNISNGQFAKNVNCQGMPKDDDRWPS